MRGVAFASAAVAVAIAACNVLIGVNDFSTPSCEDCERRECTNEFNACIGNGPCANFTHCLETCTSTSCDCLPPIPTPLDDAGTTATFQACAQTRCAVCAGPRAPERPITTGPVPPPPQDATTE